MTLFRNISRALAAEFSTVREIPQRGESGRATESALRAVLRRHLPSRFDVFSGFAVGKGGVVSSQADILVIDSLNCVRLLQTEGTGVFPIEGILARIEVTQNLTSSKRQDDFEKIVQFRGIEASLPYAPDFQDSAPLGVIFTERSAVSLDSHAEWLAGKWKETLEGGRRQLPNSIVVLEKGAVLYANERGAIHCDPSNAWAVISIADPDCALLVWFLITLSRFRILIEHRIRARALIILAIRQKEELERGRANLILEATGAEPYFPDLVEYFSVNDRATLERITPNIKVIPLR